ncbi:hypothetical protein WICPIJ_001683 [Wickerhamomyces pijperi]|uniref:RRM domain-containing protein n=1 Tax=Wickerhamomyces pijperi TaxID=599730 RepID=A0A9P8QDA5_WICPI|nr:hypothetical protein WICPIJ_001683 [Wickerhamomyces pijperi]
MERKARKYIYIGSIPYDQTEQQVLEIANTIGPVVNMKMMFDKETGKSKGYAFIEYKDVETASSAVRNLNNYTIGNRQLKCDFSTENSLTGNGNNYGSSNSNSNNSHIHSNKKRDQLPPLPTGVTLGPGENYQASIAQSLRSLDSHRLNTLIQDSIQASRSNPRLMKQLLQQCPQLAYAIVEGLLMSKSVGAEDIANLLQPSTDSNSSTTTTKGNKNDSTNLIESGEVEEELDEEKIELVKQVLNIPQEELNDLPQEQREAILLIKGNYEKGIYGEIKV